MRNHLYYQKIRSFRPFPFLPLLRNTLASLSYREAFRLVIMPRAYRFYFALFSQSSKVPKICGPRGVIDVLYPFFSSSPFSGRP